MVYQLGVNLKQLVRGKEKKNLSRGSKAKKQNEREGEEKKKKKNRTTQKKHPDHFKSLSPLLY